MAAVRAARTRSCASAPLREEVVVDPVRAEVRLPVPFEVPVERRRVEVVEELDAADDEVVPRVHEDVAVDLPVVGFDDPAPVVAARPDAEAEAAVLVVITVIL